uniref:Uncharacterized protein n=1 Tax=viral metagenome TaxID=1070528 RepID=A0A6C0LZZ9_9ZZZZ
MNECQSAKGKVTGNALIQSMPMLRNDAIVSWVSDDRDPVPCEVGTGVVVIVVTTVGRVLAMSGLYMAIPDTRLYRLSILVFMD